MDNFFFDLQRFAVDYAITAGNSITVSDAKGAITFSLTTGSGTVNYQLTKGTYSDTVVNNAIKIDTDTDGTIKICTNSTDGYINALQYLGASGRPPYVFLHGILSTSGAQMVTFGENGPTLNGIGGGTSSRYLKCVFTPNSDYDTLDICFDAKLNQDFSQNPFLRGITFGDSTLVYRPIMQSDSSRTISFRINHTTGRTYFDVSSADDPDDTLTYNDGTGEKNYKPISGTITVAIDKDGSNFAVKGFDEGDSFQLGDVVYTRTAQNLKAVSYAKGTSKALTGNTLPAVSNELLISDLDFDSENFSEQNLIDGVDYCTYLNPGLVSLLADGSTATQFTDAASSTTGVEIGVGEMVNNNPPVVMEMPNRISKGTTTRMLIDIALPTTSPKVLRIYFPFNSSEFYVQLKLSNTGSLQGDVINNVEVLDTIPAINLADYGVDLTKPIRFALQATFTNTLFTKAWWSLEFGSYVYTKQLENASIPFSSTNKLLKLFSNAEETIKISNIIVRDDSVGQLLEQIVPLAVSTTDTDMTESNGLYTATVANQSLLQTPDISGLLTTFKRTDTVKNILVVGNPAYKKNGALNRLTCIEKNGNTVTTHNSVALGTSTIKAISDNWGVKNITLNDLTDMQFGWKAEA